jgi:hypothetical protein
MKRHRRQNRKKAFDKYDYYHRAVQSCEEDVKFLRRIYKNRHGKDAKVLREDFCGTFALSCEWVKLNQNFRSIGVDLDQEPLDYGRSHYWSQLTPDQQRRLSIKKNNVLSGRLPKADLVVAMNFSYCLFKTREQMKKYYGNVYKSLNRGGIFILDTFGGSHCYDSNVEVTRHRGFTYYWDQAGFDPITNQAMFYIHFKPKGQKKISRVFSYDWRIWSIPEIREMLSEVGFRRTAVYWEGTTSTGGGNGVFRRTEKGESCESWIAYISAEK